MTSRNKVLARENTCGKVKENLANAFSRYTERVMCKSTRQQNVVSSAIFVIAIKNQNTTVCILVDNTCIETQLSLRDYKH